MSRIKTKTNFIYTDINKVQHIMDFGLIFHWGIYSITAYDDPISAKRRRMQNGSEWYLKRLLEDGRFRPISGWKETQEDYKTGEDLMILHQQVKEKGGRFLLNLGPDYNGRLDPKEVTVLRDFAELKK